MTDNQGNTEMPLERPEEGSAKDNLGFAEEISSKIPERGHQAHSREVALPEFVQESGQGNLGMLMNVNLQLTVELGRTNMTVRQVLDLQKGAVVELDRIAGEAVDVYVNDRMIARGDVVVVDDKFGVRITELVGPNQLG
jgi:flagellar motor switch protein FliN